MQIDDSDPKGLVRESYAIDGITLEECRSIFLDWALSLGPQTQVVEAIGILLRRYDAPDHPMSAVLRDGIAPEPVARRRGGRSGRMYHGR